MKSNELIAMDKDVVETGFVTAAENVNWVIKDMSVIQPRMFVNLIPRSTYALGSGLVNTIQKFYGDIGDQGGLTFWERIKTSTPATNEAPAFDSCNPPKARLTGHGIARQNYYGWQTALRTPDICINDIKWTTEFKQQVGLIFKHLAEITMQTWENIGREGYMFFNRNLVCSDGSPDASGFTYDPFTSTRITLPSATKIGMINWRWLRWHHQYLSLQNRASASGSVSGLPVWPLIVDPADTDDMIRADSVLREDIRYSKDAHLLIENYMALKTIRGMFALNFDIITPRFNEISNDGTTRTLERVAPFEKVAVYIGERPKISTEYMNAQYGIAHIFLKDTYSMEIPPAGPASAGGGTEFGVIPGLMGKFEWMNIQNETTNRYKEKGHYDARYQAFLKPGDFSGEGINILYKRIVNTPIQLWDFGTEGTGAIANVGVAVKVGTAATYNQVDVTVASFLPCQANGSVTVSYTDDGAKTAVASIADDGKAPTYRLTFATDADWVAKLASSFTLTCV